FHECLPVDPELCTRNQEIKNATREQAFPYDSDSMIPTTPGGSNMGKAFWQRKVWWSQLVLAGLIVWLGHEILVARAGQGQADRKSVVIDRAPLRFIKDPNPS